MTAHATHAMQGRATISHGAAASKVRSALAAALALAFAGSIGSAQAQDAPQVKVPEQKPRTIADTDPAAAYGGVEKISRMMLDKMATANATPTLRGSGPYPAKLEIDLAYPNATLYRPADLHSLGSKKLGLLVWGNGGFTSDGSSAAGHLAEIASHGYLAIAPGKPMSGPAAPPGARAPAIMTSSVDDLRNIMNWALAENERQGSPYFHRIDPRMVAVSGASCGGMQAIILSQDPRVSAVIIHNSGLFPILPDLNPLLIDPERVQGLHTPVLFITGGKIDLAHPFAIAAYDKITRQPSILASIDVGHSGTFADPHGGAAAKVALDWLEWRLRGNAEASRTFVGADCRLCADPQWTLLKKNLR